MTGKKADGTSKKAQLRAMRGLPEPQKCKRIKRDGERCGNAPISGATVCRMHGGAAPQVRRKAAERLAAHADILMAALLKIAASAESEAVRLSAVRDALDRAGFGAAQMLKLVPGDDPWSHLLEEIMDDDVLVRVTDHALPPPNPDGGRATDDDDEDYARNAVQTVEYVDNDSMEWEELSLDRPGTLRGEVIRDYGPQTPTAPGGTSCNRPPKYLRDALEEEGIDWHEGDGGRATDDDDEDYARNAVQTVEYVDNDSMEWEELSLDRPGTLRGEVIRDYGPQTPTAPGGTSCNRPPKYLRDALEEEGIDWHEGSGGRGSGSAFA